MCTSLKTNLLTIVVSRQNQDSAAAVAFLVLCLNSAIPSYYHAVLKALLALVTAHSGHTRPETAQLSPKCKAHRRDRKMLRPHTIMCPGYSPAQTYGWPVPRYHKGHREVTSFSSCPKNMFLLSGGTPTFNRPPPPSPEPEIIQRRGE